MQTTIFWFLQAGEGCQPEKKAKKAKCILDIDNKLHDHGVKIVLTDVLGGGYQQV